MHPNEVKIIIYAARNLQPNKKGGVCQASVIFGVGKRKYRTEVVKSDNPTWNEEGIINVSNPNASLVLSVMDGEDNIGNVTLPVINLPSAAHKRRWLPLQRKHQGTPSDLCFDCWITQFKKETVWNKFNPFFSTTRSQQEKRRESIASASTGIRGSTSTLELSSKSFEQDRRDSQTDDTKTRRLSSSGKTASSTDLSNFIPPQAPPIVPQETLMPRPKLLPTLGAVMSMKGPPEITGISPRFGPSSGGTKITIRGCNLGTNFGDFLGFTICSVDHLDNLEYHTPAKLVTTTQAWDGKKPNPGPIVLITKSGGRGVSTIKFEFQGEPVITGKKNLAAERKDESKKKGTKGAKHETSKDVENLRRNVEALKSENQSLRNYIDKLMVVLMEKYPDALESTMSVELGK